MKKFVCFLAVTATCCSTNRISTEYLLSISEKDTGEPVTYLYLERNKKRVDKNGFVLNKVPFSMTVLHTPLNELNIISCCELGRVFSLAKEVDTLMTKYGDTGFDRLVMEYRMNGVMKDKVRLLENTRSRFDYQNLRIQLINTKDIEFCRCSTVKHRLQEDSIGLVKEGYFKKVNSLKSVGSDDLEFIQENFETIYKFWQSLP